MKRWQVKVYAKDRDQPAIRELLKGITRHFYPSAGFGFAIFDEKDQFLICCRWDTDIMHVRSFFLEQGSRTIPDETRIPYSWLPIVATEAKAWNDHVLLQTTPRYDEYLQIRHKGRKKR